MAENMKFDEAFALISEIKRDANWTAEHVGAPGCLIRKRAAATLVLLDELERRIRAEIPHTLTAGY